MHTPSNIPSSFMRDAPNGVMPQRREPVLLEAVPKRQPKSIAIGLSASFICLSVEPEDAKITGATRSLSRRLLALNLPPAS